MDFNEEINKNNESNVISLPIAQSADTMGKQILCLYGFLQSIGIGLLKKDSMKGIYEKLTSKSMPKAVGIDTRRKLMDMGIQVATNSSLETFENLQQYQPLIKYASFSDDCRSFSILDIDTNSFSSYDLKVYNKAKKMEKTLNPSNSEFSDFLESKNLRTATHRGISCIIGPIIQNLDSVVLNYKDLNDRLPRNACLIEYQGSPFIYVESPCDLALSLRVKGLPIINFYRTFEGGLPIAGDPLCEDLPKHTFFDVIDGEILLLIVGGIEDYYLLVQRGIHQKYSNLDTYDSSKTR